MKVEFFACPWSHLPRRALCMISKAAIWVKEADAQQSKAVKWRRQSAEKRAASQISSILLQRRDYFPLLRHFNLPFKLNNSIFRQIVHKTESNPVVLINFYKWAKKNLGFQPDLESDCRIIELAVTSCHVEFSKELLESLIDTQTNGVLVSSIIQLCGGNNSVSQIMGFIIEIYVNKGLYMEGLDVYKNIRASCLEVNGISTYNSLLNSFEQAGKMGLFWCFYSIFVRTGTAANNITWESVTRVLHKQGKMEMIGRLLDSGIHEGFMYNSIIDLCSKRGLFQGALSRLSEMSDRNIDPGFSTYGSILDGSCRHGNVDVRRIIMGAMVNKGYFHYHPYPNYDSFIHKLSDIRATYVADMFFRASQSEKVKLQASTYGCLLTAFSIEGRVQEAIRVHRIIMEKKMVVEQNCYAAFGCALCKQEPWDETSDLLRDILQRSVTVCGNDLSKFIASQCERGKFREAEKLLNIALEKGLLPDFSCCCSLVESCCGLGEIDLAIELHRKIEQVKGRLDANAYEKLLEGLVAMNRVNEAAEVFDYMREQRVLSSASYVAVISGLCGEGEFKRAMKLHDEMLEMGFKPNKTAYISLIRWFE